MPVNLRTYLKLIESLSGLHFQGKYIIGKPVNIYLKNLRKAVSRLMVSVHEL